MVPKWSLPAGANCQPGSRTPACHPPDKQPPPALPCSNTDRARCISLFFDFANKVVVLIVHNLWKSCSLFPFRLFVSAGVALPADWNPNLISDIKPVVPWQRTLIPHWAAPTAPARYPFRW